MPKQITVNTSDDLYARISTEAKQTGKTVSELIREVLVVVWPEPLTVTPTVTNVTVTQPKENKDISLTVTPNSYPAPAKQQTRDFRRKVKDPETHPRLCPQCGWNIIWADEDNGCCSNEKCRNYNPEIASYWLSHKTRSG